MNNKNILITILTILLILSCCCNIFFVLASYGLDLNISNLLNKKHSIVEYQDTSEIKAMLVYTLENYHLKSNELTDKYSCAIKVLDYSLDEKAAMKGLEKYYFIASCYGYQKDNPGISGTSFSNVLFYAEYLGSNALFVDKPPIVIKEFDFPNNYLNSNDKNYASDKDKEMIRLSLQEKSNDLYDQAMVKALSSKY